MKKLRQVIFCLLLTQLHVYAQDDLMSQLQSEMHATQEKTFATFKGDKVVNIQTNETVKKNNLDFRVKHLFGNIGNESGGGFHTLYGLDQSNDIQIGFHYGISDRLMAGFSRCKRNENLEGLVKFRLFEQTTDDKKPVGVTLFGNSTLSTKSSDLVQKFEHRLTYFAQAIIARKFSTKFSALLAPSYLHRNQVPQNNKNDVMSVGAGLRCKVTHSTSVIVDYSFVTDKRKEFPKQMDPVGVGMEIETGGHVFSILFTNASGILENDYLPNTVDDWMKGGVKFSFIISRMFKFGKIVR